MKKIQKLTKEINELTLLIQEKYPELYQHLDENPEIIKGKNDKLTTKNFSEYLESLKQLLKSKVEGIEKNNT